MFHPLTHVRIAGVRVAVPNTEIRLEDEAAFYGGNTKKIGRLKATLGMDRRRAVPPDVTASDLCAHAAVNLLDALPDSRDAIDALVFVSQTPDWHQPATACELQHRLGLKTSCAAFDVNQGCSGYVYGLWLASSLIAAGSARQVLLLVGYAYPYGHDVRNRIVAPVFGDGGSATLLIRDEQAPPMYFGLGTDGSGFETIITPAGKSRIPFVRDEAENRALVRDIPDPAGNIWQLADLYMDGGAVFDFTMDVVPAHIKAALEHAGLTESDIELLVLHQANRKIVLNVAEKAGFPESKTPSDSFSKYGNLEAVSIPAALCDAFGGAPHGPGRVLLCGYGIGLSWASCICTIDRWNSAPLLEFEADPCRPTRQQRIERWEQILRGEKSRHE